MPGVLQDFHSPAWGELLSFSFLELSYPSCFVGNQMRDLGNSLEESDSQTFTAEGSQRRETEHGYRQPSMTSVDTVKKRTAPKDSLCVGASPPRHSTKGWGLSVACPWASNEGPELMAPEATSYTAVAISP